MSTSPTRATRSLLKQVYHSFIGIFIATCNKIIGMKQRNPKQNHWFSFPGIKAGYRELLAVRQRHPKNRHHPNRRAAESKWNKLQAEAKLHQWESLCNNLGCSSTTNNPLQWQHFKRVTPSSHAPLTSFPDTNQQLPTSHQQSLDNLCAYYSQAATPEQCKHPRTITRLRNMKQNLLNPNNPAHLPAHVSDTWTFTVADVTEQCTKQRTNTAGGADTILPIFLAHAGQQTYQALSILFSFSWEHGVLPRAWTEANVMSLYKGEGEKSDPSSFRPISLTSIVIRTFEHMIHRKLVSFLDSNNFFHPLQFGFRASHSCSDATNHLLFTIKGVCNTKKAAPLSNYCPVIFLDLKKAFDKVWHLYLLDILLRSNISGKAWRWIAAFLSNRKIRTVDLNEASRWHSIYSGVPQGSVLSPLLFIIFINPIIKKISAKHELVQPILYADDMALMPRKKNRIRLRHGKYMEQLQKSLDLLTTWCEHTGMIFNAKKTKVVVYTGVQEPDYEPYDNLTLCNFIIDRALSYEYLGLHIHYRLSWKTHITSIITRAQYDSHRISCLARTSTNSSVPPPSFTAIRTLVLCYLLPRWTYGLTYWGEGLNHEYSRKLQSLLLRPIRCSLKLPPTTHQLSLLVETHLASIPALHRYMSICTYLRILQLPPTHPSPAQLRSDLYIDPRDQSPLDPRRWAHTHLITTLEHSVHYINAIIPHIKKQYRSQHLRPPTSLRLPTLQTIDNFTRPTIKEFLMWDTHHEWMNEDRQEHHTSAPLSLMNCKPIPCKSLFLTYDKHTIATLRAKLRLDRANTQQRLNHISTQVPPTPSPLCTFPACQNQPIPPNTTPSVDSPTHILLFCHRHHADRLVLTQALAAIHYILPLTVAFITGTTPYEPQPNIPRTKALLSCSATFLQSIVASRSNDPALTPFITESPG